MKWLWAKLALLFCSMRLELAAVMQALVLSLARKIFGSMLALDLFAMKLCFGFWFATAFDWYKLSLDFEVPFCDAISALVCLDKSSD